MYTIFFLLSFLSCVFLCASSGTDFFEEDGQTALAIYCQNTEEPTPPTPVHYEFVRPGAFCPREKKIDGRRHELSGFIVAGAIIEVHHLFTKCDTITTSKKKN